MPQLLLLHLQLQEPLQGAELDCITVHDAVQRGHMGCLKQLLANDPSLALATNKQVETPLHAVKHDTAQRCYAVTTALLAAAAAAAQSPAAVGEQLGEQLLYNTYNYERVCHPCLRALVAAGALPDPEQEDNEDTFVHRILQTTALHEGTAEQQAAAVAESTETLQQLIAAGVELYDGQLASVCEWEFAVGASLNAARVLLACGADVHYRSAHSGRTALHSAAMYDGKAELIQVLIDAGAELEARDDEGCTALIYAALYADLGNAQKLLQLGANVDVQDSTGRTALLAACESGPERNCALVEQLLALGADVKQRTNRNSAANVPEDGLRQAIHIAAAS